MSCCFIGQVMCCVTEDYEDLRKPDKRKLRRGRRQAARETLLHELQFSEYGRKTRRKMKAIEKSLSRHFAEQKKAGTNNVWIPRGRL